MRFTTAFIAAHLQIQQFDRPQTQFGQQHQAIPPAPDGLIFWVRRKQFEDLLVLLK